MREQYGYDAQDRLTSATRQDAPVELDHRYYDKAGRVLQTGLAETLSQAWIDAAGPASVNANVRVNEYDSQGRLAVQHVYDRDRNLTQDIGYDRYDAAGNLLQYTLHQHRDDSFRNTYGYTLARFEGYKERAVHATSTLFEPGQSRDYYDVNGELIALTDDTKGENNRGFVNDVTGSALQEEQRGHDASFDGVAPSEEAGPQKQRQLIVNGQVLARYGIGIDANDPRSDDGTPRFTPVAEFGLTYRAIDGNYPSAGQGSYTVHAGDTLQSIAQAAYGDSRLWFKIAQANGIASASELKVGQTLNIPSAVAGSHNASGDYKPYDPSKVTGDTTPNMPAPDGDDCGGLGQILVVVVAVVVSILSYGALSGVVGTIAAGAISGAAGALAGQVVGNIVGTMDGFDWKGIALGAIGGAVAGGLSGVNFAANAVVNTAVRVAIGNAVSQGIGVATGLQREFNWKAVAASAVGGAIGQALGDAMGLSANGGRPAGMEVGEFVAKASLKGFVAGLTTAVARGGTVAAQQVAVDAFGNALGSSLAGAATSGGSGSPQDGYGIRFSDGAVQSFGQPASSFDTSFPSDYGLTGGGARLPAGQGSGELSPEDALASFRQSERDSFRGTSVAGRSYVAQSGDSYSSMAGSSSTQAVGNIMRANGAGNTTVIAGRNYFIPDEVSAYGDQSALGQAAIAHDNQVAYLKARLEIANEGLRMMNRAEADAATWSAPTGSGGQAGSLPPELIVGTPEWFRTASTQALHANGYQTLEPAPAGLSAEPTLSVGEQAIRNSWGYQQATNLAGSVVGVSKGIGETGASLAWNLREGNYGAATVDAALLATTVAPGLGGAAVRALQSERAALMSSLNVEMRAGLLADLPAVEGLAPEVRSVSLTPVGRIDYSRGLANDLLVNFNPGYSRFSGSLQDDLTLVQFHRSDRELGQGRSAMWWTSPDQANSMSTIGDVRGSLALPPGWGARDAVSVARIPSGTEVEYYLGSAAPQVDGGLRYTGNGLQMRFKNFDPSWVIQTRNIPGQP